MRARVVSRRQTYNRMKIQANIPLPPTWRGYSQSGQESFDIHTLAQQAYHYTL
jgi:hypothetical protein